MGSDQILVNNFLLENIFVFLGIFLFWLLSKNNTKSESTSIISHEQGTELKGLAILLIIVAHIGYVLSTDNRFLFPLSDFAGVGVDLFLLLSGYGLTLSMMKKQQSPFGFYKHRLLKIIVPFWCAFFVILIADYLLLDKSYNWKTILEGLFLWFPRADAWNDINSPFWYMTWIGVYYLLFPLFFLKKHIGLSALLIFLVMSAFPYFDPLELDVTWLHRLHTGAFSVGMILAAYGSSISHYREILVKKFHLDSIVTRGIFILGILVTGYGIWKINSRELANTFFVLENYTHGYAVIEQGKSIVLCIFAILLVELNTFRSKFLMLLGVFSYEIYLIHWPLLSRYDVLYSIAPVWLSTLLWLILFIGISYILRKLTFFFERKRTPTH